MSNADLCPRCEENYFTSYDTKPFFANLHAPYPALSRIDNKTYICPECGQDEAMRDFAGAPPVPPDEWPIDKVERV
jgi:hypothetical protein